MVKHLPTIGKWTIIVHGRAKGLALPHLFGINVYLQTYLILSRLLPLFLSSVNWCEECSLFLQALSFAVGISGPWKNTPVNPSPSSFLGKSWLATSKAPVTQGLNPDAPIPCLVQPLGIYDLKFIRNHTCVALSKAKPCSAMYLNCSVSSTGTIFLMTFLLWNVFNVREDKRVIATLLKFPCH